MTHSAKQFSEVLLKYPNHCWEKVQPPFLSCACIYMYVYIPYILFLCIDIKL